MSRDECRYWGCEREPRSDVSGFGGRFCSEEHELKYEHIEADAREAAREDQHEVHHDDVPRGGRF